MVLNVIWVSFFVIAFVTAIVRLSMGEVDVFPAINTALFDSAKTAAEISLGYIGMMTLWLGIMKIGEKGGAIAVLTRLVAPFFQRLFPEIPKGHPASGAIMMNFSANMLGLDNAATPLGLKAMGYLQELNPNKETASNAMIMFLVLNVSGLTIIPISVITLRAVNGAANPTDIFLPILIATYFATLAGLIAVAVMQKINLLHPIVLAYLGGATALICGLVLYFQNPRFYADAHIPVDTEEVVQADEVAMALASPASDAQTKIAAMLSPEQLEAIAIAKETDKPSVIATAFSAAISSGTGWETIDPRARRELIDGAYPKQINTLRTKLIEKQSGLLAACVILGTIIAFLALAIRQRVNIYETFIEGGKEGFNVAVKIIPYLVAMLVAIGVFRASGALDAIMDGVRWVVSGFGAPTDFVDALPTAAMKPLSGSGARGLAVETMQNFSADSFQGQLACTFQGSTETLFFVLAVYYGAVGVKKTRYTVTCGLIADVVGVTAAILVAYLFFPR